MCEIDAIKFEVDHYRKKNFRLGDNYTLHELFSFSGLSYHVMATQKTQNNETKTKYLESVVIVGAIGSFFAGALHGHWTLITNEPLVPTQISLENQ